MKIRLLCLSLTVLSLNLFAQGRLTLANDTSRLFVFNENAMYESDMAYSGQPIPTGILPSGNTLSMALYASTTAGSLSLQTAFSLVGANMAEPGRMTPKPMTLGGIPGGGSRYFQIFVWNDWGNQIPSSIASEIDFRMAVNSFYYGTSGLFTFTPGTSAISAPFIYGWDSTWSAGIVTIYGAPEPSSFTLMALGIGALVAFRRSGRSI
jgi:hypothetical protein